MSSISPELTWEDSPRLPPLALQRPPLRTRTLTYQLSPTGSTSGHWSRGKQNDYIASDLIITSSLLFILW